MTCTLRQAILAVVVANALAAGACGSRLSGPDGAARGGAGGGGRGGAGGGAGGTTDAGTTDADAQDAGPPPRQIGCSPAAGAGGSGGPLTPSLAPCGADGSCADGQACFRLSSELAVCDIAQRTPASGCTPDCAAGQICRDYPSGPCSVPGKISYCVDTACTSATDCAEGTACTPTSFIGDYVCGLTGGDSYGNTRCMPRACQSDQDCTGGPNGRCVLVNRAAGQGYNGVLITRLDVACVYSGSPADPGACAGAWSCGDGSYHLCPNADGGVP